MLQAKLAPTAVARHAAQSHLVNRLGKLHGLPQKMGQMLSFSWSEPSANPFAKLQDKGTALPLHEIRPLLERAWNRPVDSVLLELQPSSHAASIGQVHRGKLKNGKEVAIKIQFPTIREAINSDLGALGWLSLPLGGLSRGFDLAAYQKAIQSGLDEELDYELELKTQTLLRQLVNSPEICIPEPVSELTTKSILVSEWVENVAFDEAVGAISSSQRKRMCHELVRWFLDGLLNQGVMQADWHPGNVRLRAFSSTSPWVLFDFGATCRLSTTARQTLRTLLLSPPSNSEAWELLVDLGFEPTWLAGMREKLGSLCALLFEPFYSEKPFNLNDWRLSERMSALLGDDRWNFRFAAPASLLPLMRSFHGLIYYLRRMDTAIDFKSMSSDLKQPATLRTHQPAITRVDASQSPTKQAQTLRIRVQRNGETKVQLSFPASAAERLESLIDDDLAVKIAAQKIDLSALSKSFQVHQRVPGRLFFLEDGSRTIEVSLF